MAGLVLGLPAAIAIAAILKLAGVQFAEAALWCLVVAWTSIWGWSAFRVIRWPCPRCGNPWLAGQNPQLGVKRSCAVCGLELYQAPKDPA